MYIYIFTSHNIMRKAIACFILKVTSKRFLFYHKCILSRLCCKMRTKLSFPFSSSYNLNLS